METPPLRQQVETLAAISSHRETWLDLRQRHQRSAGLDANLTKEWEAHNDRMNNLLERYFSQKLKQDFNETVADIEPISVPIKHTNETYPLEVDYDQA